MIKKIKFFLLTNSSTIQPGSLLLSKSFLVLVNTYVWSLQGQVYLIHTASSSCCICNFNKLQRIMRWCGPLCRAITGLPKLPNPCWGSRKSLPGSMGTSNSVWAILKVIRRLEFHSDSLSCQKRWLKHFIEFHRWSSHSVYYRS